MFLRLALDSYAVWWDAHLQSQILRAGNRISNFHVSDWLPETRDVSAWIGECRGMDSSTTP